MRQGLASYEKSAVRVGTWEGGINMLANQMVNEEWTRWPGSV